jgi:hypothetical protein
MQHLADLIPREYRGPGLSAQELAVAQEASGVAFPPDLCALLTETLPTGSGFPDWRHNPQGAMQEWRDWLVDTIHFDVVNNGFWLPEWQSRPDDRDRSRTVLANYLTEAPMLIPIYGHRAIPNEPLETGNPVFSVMQTDIIVYGRDLADYLVAEFDPSKHEPIGLVSTIRPIRFWTRMLDPS